MCRVGRETQPERRDPHRPFHRRRRGRALRQGTGRRGHPDQRGSACDGQVRQKPGGLPIEVLDQIRQSTAYNRPQYYQDFTLPFYGYNRPGAKISQGIRDNWWRQGMMGGIKAQYDCIKAFSETDFTKDLKKIEVPRWYYTAKTTRLFLSPMPAGFP